MKFGRQSRDHSLLGTIWIGAISGGLLLGRRVGTTDRPFARETIVRSLTHLRVEKVRKEESAKTTLGKEERFVEPRTL